MFIVFHYHHGGFIYLLFLDAIVYLRCTRQTTTTLESTEIVWIELNRSHKLKLNIFLHLMFFSCAPRCWLAFIVSFALSMCVVCVMCVMCLWINIILCVCGSCLHNAQPSHNILSLIFHFIGPIAMNQYVILLFICGHFRWPIVNLHVKTDKTSHSLVHDTIAKMNRILIFLSFFAEPNTPGKFIVWFRNETTLLVLWQPPYPAGIYTHYKVSIEPPDALESVLYVEKEGEPPGPAQAAFKGLVPGRAYNISVQTMSEDEISLPTTAQYRTVPLKPSNVTFDPDSTSSNGFRVMWESPKGMSEFDKYQVSISTSRRQQTVPRTGDSVAWLEFKDNLEPGRTYQVIVKTVSGKVTSWPATADVTLKPLPVQNLQAVSNERTGLVTITWEPDSSSYQEEYRISYHEVETFNGDSSTMTTNQTSNVLESLLPGRNYSLTVQAISKRMESNETTIYIVTRPSSPIIEDRKSIKDGLNISWKSDVNSRQDKYEVMYSRNDTGEVKTIWTTESRLVIKNLFPGAGYEVKVFAVSHGLRSEPHSYFLAVCKFTVCSHPIWRRK